MGALFLVSHRKGISRMHYKYSINLAKLIGVIGASILSILLLTSKALALEEGVANASALNAQGAVTASTEIVNSSEILLTSPVTTAISLTILATIFVSYRIANSLSK